MKLLLSSAGLTNQSIAGALVDLVDKKAEEAKIGFITTAVNVEEGNKVWYISQLNNLLKYGFKWIDVVDISAPGVDWKARLATVDVIVVSGGNTFHLLDQMRRVGFAEWFKSVADQKVYVGISAGTIVMTPSVAVASVDNGDINWAGITDLTGLGFVDFELSPHTPEYVSHEGNRKYVQDSGAVLYGLDDQSAIKVVDGEMEVVSEGEWVKY